MHGHVSGACGGSRLAATQQRSEERTHRRGSSEWEIESLRRSGTFGRNNRPLIIELGNGLEHLFGCNLLGIIGHMEQVFFQFDLHLLNTRKP